MKKRNVVIIALTTSILMSGCGNAIPEMTETQQNMVTEYAVGTLLKYSANYDNRMLVKDMDMDGKTEVSVVEEIQPQENLEVVSPVEETDMTEVPSVSINEPAAAISIESFLGLDGFTVQFQGSEVCDAYSGAEENEVAFEMRASEGRQLLVLKYSVTNFSDTEQTLDILSKNVKAKIGADGSEKNALLTMLEDDFLNAETIMGANESRTFVVLSEIPEGARVGDIIVSFTCDGKNVKYTY